MTETKQVPVGLLRIMAEQRMTTDMTVDELNDPDFKLAYDAMVQNARSLLNYSAAPATEPSEVERLAVEIPFAAIENLTKHQGQADMDGVMVTVSRQALDEVLEYLASTVGGPDQ